jgi:hypothetical protein
VPIEALLVPMGAVILFQRLLRAGKRAGYLSVDGLVLLTVAVYFVGVTATLYVAWARYFLPTLLLGILLSGIGVSTILHRLPSLWTDLQILSRPSVAAPNNRRG